MQCSILYTVTGTVPVALLVVVLVSADLKLVRDSVLLLRGQLDIQVVTGES